MARSSFELAAGGLQAEGSTRASARTALRAWKFRRTARPPSRIRRGLRQCALAAVFAGALAGCQWTRASIERDGAESQRLVEQARTAVLAGDLQQADTLLDRAGIVCPDDPAVHCQRAELRRAHGDIAGAISELRIAAARDPGSAETFARLADLLLQQDRVGEADVAATSALALDARHPSALEIKAAAAERRRRDDLALEMYHRLLAEAPDDSRAKLRVAEIELRCGRPERAAPLLRDVCQSLQTDAQERSEAQWLLGIAYGAEGRWADAVRELAAAAPQRARMTADDRIAYARTQLGDADGAGDDLARVFGIEPEHDPALAMRSALRGQTASSSSSMTAGGHSVSGFPPPAGWPLPDAIEATASLSRELQP